MKRRIHFSLLISAIGGLVVLGAGVPKGHTLQDRIHTIPEAWRGTWEVTVSYRDRDTGAVVATDVTTAEICPNESIIPSQLNAYVRCSNEAGDNEIAVSCRNRQRMILDHGCDVFGAAELTSHVTATPGTALEAGH